ncbi:MAG: radical SAM protein [Planctomycetes bacterium]|nr:radical SAM protein [Planctomycetota bacterium]
MAAKPARGPTIILVDPSYYRLFKDSYSLSRYPLSLGYLAGQVRWLTDWNVVVYNADFRPEAEPYQLSHLCGAGFESYLANLANPQAAIWQEISQTLAGYAPKVVGISCKSQTFASACLVARMVKQVNPQTQVIVGGPHAAMVGPEILSCLDVDVVVRGEGEQTIIELLDAFRAGRPLDGIAGIVFRKNGQVVQNPSRPFLADLDSLCYPHEAAEEVLHDYALYPLDGFSHVFATRGCPYDCFFCGSKNVWGRKVRFRSAENVVEELRRLQRFGLRSVHFDDDTFGVKPAYIRQLCDAIRRDCPHLSWSCELHVNLVTDQVLAMMASAGCRAIQLGIESGNNEILKQIRKGFSIDKAIAAAEAIGRHGMAVQAFFMVGFPHETEATLTETVTAMKKIKGQLSYSIFTPYPGTEAFEYCSRRGLVGDDYDPALHNHQSPLNCFCEHIRPDRFRLLVSRIERMVERNNRPGSLCRLLAYRGSIGRAIQKGWAKLRRNVLSHAGRGSASGGFDRDGV